MTSQPRPSTAELMHILKFDADELALNRQGRLSLMQRVRVVDGSDAYFTFLVALLPVWVIAWALGFVPLIQIPFLVAFGVIIAAVYPTSVKTFIDVVTGQVMHVSGPLTIQPYNRSQRTFVGTFVQQFANGTIGGITFLIPIEMANRFQGVPLQIYYTSRSRNMVSAEVIE